MYCNKCGNQIGENEKFCTNCGAQNPLLQNSSAQTTTENTVATSSQSQQQVQQQAPKENTVAIVGFIFSFFGGLIGLICSIIGYINGRKGAPYKNLALAGIIISVAVFVISIIVFRGIVSALLGSL